MTSSDIIAFVSGGKIYHESCITYDESRDMTPVFAGEEFDTIPVCDRCLEAIDNINLVE